MAEEAKWCCAMRRKFLIGVVAVYSDVPTPVELADHVLHWGVDGQPTVMTYKFCPFCGEGNRGDNLRVASGFNNFDGRGGKK